MTRRAPSPKAALAMDAVRQKIAGGTLKPGGAAPSGAGLAREAGCAVLTARKALRALAADGTLAPGASPAGRLRVARPGGSGAAGADRLRAAPSRALRARRRAAELTQRELAAKLGVSVTTIGHAETGRTWQSREFWERADRFLGGGILRAYDEFEAAGFTAPGEGGPVKPGEGVTAAIALPASVTITAGGVVILWPDGTKALVRPPG